MSELAWERLVVDDRRVDCRKRVFRHFIVEGIQELIHQCEGRRSGATPELVILICSGY